MIGFTHLFHIDRLSIIVMLLVLFVSTCIGSYSLRYLKGDRGQARFFVTMTLMVMSVFVMVCADNIVLFLLSWGLSNMLLTRLMLHKRGWAAAEKSSRLALANFSLGFAFLAAALLLFYYISGETSIQNIVSSAVDSKWVLAGCVLILLAGMTQSALWPFHGWLTSSLNSPTPVSAMMHAGLVNGGGFLLARFMPILASQPVILNVIFLAGIATALLGTFWKLIQSDIKRMLACSTMGQMGFMIAQCGLGLFPAAIAHLCWHGLFKAYLFLASGSAAKEKRLDLDYPPSLKHFFAALLFGVAAACLFAVTSGKQLTVINTNLFLIFIAMIAGAQFALPIIKSERKMKLLLAFIATCIMGVLYGLSVNLIEYLLAPLRLSAPQPLNALHFIAAGLMLASWLALLFAVPNTQKTQPDWWLKQYVKALNASQPHPGTINAYRNKYQY